MALSSTPDPIDPQVSPSNKSDSRKNQSDDRLQDWCREGLLHLEAGRFEQAIACYNSALERKPDDPMILHQRGIALGGLGRYGAAIADYDRAIALSTRPTPALWCDRGHTFRCIGKHGDALKSYEAALTIQPNNELALCGKATSLAMLGRRKLAIATCDRAMSLQPDSAEVWNSYGIVLLAAHRYQDAIQRFDKALELCPTLNKAWCNRGIAQLRLGHDHEALINFERALELSLPQHEPWYVTAWVGCGFILMRQGQFDRAIAHFDKASSIQPGSYPAAFYRVASLVATGRVFTHILHPPTWVKLWPDLKIIISTLKYRFLAIALLIAFLSLGQGNWAAVARQMTSTVLSGGIIALLATDLWRNKSKLNFVWKTYFQNGILTYFRALATVVATLVTYGIADRVAPPFMRWGWADLVFGQPGNIIFQPFNLVQIQSFLSSHTSHLMAHVGLPFGLVNASLAGLLGQFAPAQLAAELNFKLVFILGFWLLLLLGIPFWARFEERIFRQGANTWAQILVRSTQFGLVHLLAGIPILGGFVLIVPGFLFACRYKYAYHRHLRQTNDPIQAQEAGVQASTADHAVYNAILVTFVVGLLLYPLYTGV